MPAPNTNGSVIEHPKAPFAGPQLLGDSYSMVLAMAEAADDMPAWGVTPGFRDEKLRLFWPTEPFFASALFSTVARYAGYGWTVEGPPLTCAAVQRLLHTCEEGQGWIPFISKVLIDLYTQ